VEQRQPSCKEEVVDGVILRRRLLIGGFRRLSDEQPPQRTSGADWRGLGRAAVAAIVDAAPSSNTHLSEKLPDRDSGVVASDDDVASNTSSTKRIGTGFASSLRSSIVWKWSDWSGGGALGGKGGGFEVGAVHEDDDKDHDDDGGRRDCTRRRAAGAAG
jgi:hypothetical protein